MNLMLRLLLLALACLSLPAQAGHLFTQASANTPINLTAGNGIQVTQTSFEGGSSGGRVDLYFQNDWDAGDAIKITVSSYVQTFSYDAPLAGTSQSSSNVSVTSDPALLAANLDLDETSPFDWTFQAVSGDFTVSGYRIYLGNETINGTGSGTVNQTQVVNSSQLGGGNVFEPISTDNSSPTGRTLDTLNGHVSGDMGSLITAMAALSDSERTKAVQKVAPESGQAISQASSQTVAGALDTVQVRMNSLRTGANFVSDTAYHTDEEQTGLASGDEYLSKAMWMKAFGGKADQKQKSGFAGFGSDIYGLAIGLDHLLENDWLVGGAVTYANTSVDMNDYRTGDSVDIDTYQLTAYSSRDFQQWYLEGMMAYARQNYESRRNTGVSGIAQGDFSGDQLALRIVTGMPLSVAQGVTIKPYVGLEFSHMTQNGYVETGAGTLSLDVEKQRTDRLWMMIGSRFSKSIQLDNGNIVTPSLHVGLRHAFDDDGIDTATSFVGGGGTFITEGQAINRNVYTVGAAVDVAQSQNFTLSVSLDAELAEDYKGYNGQLMGNWRF